MTKGRGIGKPCAQKDDFRACREYFTEVPENYFARKSGNAALHKGEVGSGLGDFLIGLNQGRGGAKLQGITLSERLEDPLYSFGIRD